MPNVTPGAGELRPHVTVLRAQMDRLDGGPARNLRPHLDRLARHLARLVSTPDLDSLLAAQAGIDQLSAGLDAAHARAPLPGIRTVRAAVYAIRAWLDSVPLDVSNADVRPDELLDIPRTGVLARLLARPPRVPARLPKRAPARRIDPAPCRQVATPSIRRPATSGQRRRR